MYPECNSRAELGVKTAKRMIRDNTGSVGDLDNDEISRALLQYLNTPLRGVTESPAKIVFGKAIRDSFPNSLVKKSWENQSHHKELGDGLDQSGDQREDGREVEEPRAPEGGQLRPDPEPSGPEAHMLG